jgi:hypothetical protein
MTNRLAKSNSPYLLQHQDNPVDWYAWGEEALDRAIKEDKPIFLSIGYAACHWCHVMAHESFEDQATAEIMNRDFINIKVDREERPDIDGIYMDAVVAMTGSGGWPMSVFLTPEGEPFFGGTYFPPTSRHNLPSFRDVLAHVTRLWADEREKVFEVGNSLLERMQASVLPLANAQGLAAETLDQAALKLAQNYDWNTGAWGQAPIFPQAMSIEFLLGRGAQGDKLSRDVALHALNAMAKGGLYDVVGGGFSRYSVDNEWLVPHFEKMLYDNAQLARVYLHGYLLSGDEHLRKVCEETLDFVSRELRDETGAFYSSLDADSEGEEGKYYVWSFEEIEGHIKAGKEIELLKAAFGLKESGNFEGQIVLQRVIDDEELAKQFSISGEEVGKSLDSSLKLLEKVRKERIRPATDDKALTAWNGLMLIAYAEAGRYLDREDYVDIARANAEFLLSDLQSEGRLLRSWRKGQAAHNAYLEDYAALILGLLALYQSDPQAHWYNEADRLANDMLAHYADDEGGFFDTSNDHEKLVRRPKELQDNATPSGNALAALALFQLAAFSGKGEWVDVATKAASALQDVATQYPSAFGQWLQAMQFEQAGGHEIAIIGTRQEREKLIQIVWGSWRPFDVMAAAETVEEANGPALLRDRPMIDGRASAYVCRQFVCERPVNEPQALRTLLAEK